LAYLAVTITKASKVIRFIQALKHVAIQKFKKFKVENIHMTKWYNPVSHVYLWGWGNN
jgi:hypothetical protein